MVATLGSKADKYSLLFPQSNIVRPSVAIFRALAPRDSSHESIAGMKASLCHRTTVDIGNGTVEIPE